MACNQSSVTDWRGRGLIADALPASRALAGSPGCSLALVFAGGNNPTEITVRVVDIANQTEAYT
jgi:hypothetical protein